MDIDIYQQCPCHSGKKIKFCCGKDIVSELSTIVAKCNSNQALSALDQIERVIAKHGEKDCLLTLQTHIYFTLGEYDKAEEVNAKFAAKNPKHPIAKQHEALTLLANGDIRAAIDRLQDGIDLVKGDEIPLPFSQAYKMIGSLLLSAGHIIAARAHLQFSLMIRGESDQQVASMLHNSFRVPNAPVLLKTDFRLLPVPEDKEWASKYEIVINALNRGQFRMALKMLEKMDGHWGGQREIVHGIAVVNSMLANADAMSGAWRRASQVEEIPAWLATEFEAMSVLFASEPNSASIDITTNEFEIKDLDAVFMLASASPRLVASDPIEEDPFGDGPAPRYGFIVLDRDNVELRDDLTGFDLPLIRGEFYLYGRQTDRPPRMVYLSAKNDDFDANFDFLKQLLSEQLNSDAIESVATTSTVASDMLTWNWHPPEKTTPELHRKWIAEYRKHVVLEKWPKIVFESLDGMTPEQAAEKSELSIPLAALVMNLEQSSVLQMSDGQDIVDLREKLGMPQPEKLDAANLDEEQLTPMRISQIDPATLSDEQIVRVYTDAFAIANGQVLKQVVPEVLKRESLKDKIPYDICYSMLAQLTDDNELAIEYLQKARTEAKQAGRNPGLFLVQEFEIRLSRGITDKLPELLDLIQKQHLSDPEVEYQLARVLERFGLISPDGRSISLPATQPGESDEGSESKIWTPDSDPAAVPASSSGGQAGSGSKIWVPGD